MVLPSKIAAAMMAPVNGQLQRDGSYVVPVGNINTNTKFTINFSQGSININPLDLIAGYAVRAFIVIVGLGLCLADLPRTIAEGTTL
jgi:hypothetical protein